MSSTPTSLRTVTVDYDCDRCHSHLMTTSLANLLDHPNLLTSTSPLLCEVCRDLAGAADQDLAAWTGTLAHIPDMDGMEWDEWEPTDRPRDMYREAEGFKWGDVLHPLGWVVSAVVIMYCLAGWIR